ncbi:MAG TPA: LPS assembly protein LptD, partial [Geobacterales bacterium]|nr:LPS assembly protein LptD [Geobacterales bacterium]
MTLTPPPRLVALSLLLLLFPLGAAAVEGIGIKADRLAYDQATDSYTAEGNVRITREGVTLLADQARLRQADSTAVAEGNVQLNQGEDIIRAQRLTLNFDTQQGEVNSADVFLKKGNFHLRSERMLKTGAADYQMDRATFTTCDGDNPSWSFSARHFDVTLGEYATARNAIFSVKGVPIFYTPYLVFPVKRERQSGFLIPRFGNSSTRGVRLDTVYYWNIAPNQDATFDLDYQSKRGVGLGVDYRYIRKQGSEGSLITYGIYDKLEERGRGYVQERHQESFSPTLSLASDINLVSDRDFYRAYGEESGDYNRQYLDSTLYVSKRFEGSVLVGEIHYQENLSQDVASNRQTLQRLPTVSYTVVSQR